jgi:hypothetical protein
MAAHPIDLDLNPDARKLARFGAVALLAFGVLAVCAWFEAFVFGFGLGAARIPVALALAAVGIAAGLCSLVHPRANLALYVLLSVLTYPIGLVVSHAILAVLFFGLFAPTGVLLRLLGRDAMQRSLRRDAATYWSDARPARPKESYFRQF